MVDPAVCGQLNKEIDAINKTFAAAKVGARTSPALTMIAGSAFVAYRLQFREGEKISRIDGMAPELSERVSMLRGRACPVRVRRLPLALEVVHPAPAPLAWGRAPIDAVPPGRALLGRVYGFDGARDLALPLASATGCHALISSMTGGGKSTLIRAAVSSLALNNSPSDLRLVLVDLKRSALLPFQSLPHVEAFAADNEGASGAIAMLAALVRSRIAGGGIGPRVVLVIDELREVVAADSATLAALGSIISLGREIGIHLIAATQHATSDAIGAVVKANFPARIVGPVVSAAAALVAAGLPGTGAEYLGGAGSFLCVAGGKVDRFSSYNFDAAAADVMAIRARAKWGGRRSSASASLVSAASDPAPIVAASPAAPDKLGEILEKIGGLLPDYGSGTVTKAALIRAAFGPDAPTGGAYDRWINRAIAAWQAGA